MHVVEIMLTFDWGGRKISEEADCHFQNVRFFQLGVACVIFANKGQNQALQMIETVIDASSSSLLQQGFKSLQKIISTLLLGCTDRVNAEHISRNKTNSCVVVRLLLTFLSSLACFLWATVDLAGRGWLASVVKLGLILFAFSCCAFDGRCLLPERLSWSVPLSWRASYLCGAGASEGREHKPLQRGHDTGGETLGRRVEILSGPSGPPRLYVGMRSFVMLLRFTAFNI